MRCSSETAGSGLRLPRGWAASWRQCCYPVLFASFGNTTHSRRHLQQPTLNCSTAPALQLLLFSAGVPNVLLILPDASLCWLQACHSACQSLLRLPGLLNQCMSAAGLGRAAKWKANMVRNAAALFSNRAADLQSYVYGQVATDTGSKQQVSPDAAAHKWLSHS